MVLLYFGAWVSQGTCLGGFGSVLASYSHRLCTSQLKARVVQEKIYLIFLETCLQIREVFFPSPPTRCCRAGGCLSCQIAGWEVLTKEILSNSSLLLFVIFLTLSFLSNLLLSPSMNTGISSVSKKGWEKLTEQKKKTGWVPRLSLEHACSYMHSAGLIPFDSSFFTDE